MSFWHGARRLFGSLSDSTRCPEVEYNPFPEMGGCAKLPWVRRGLRFTVSLRTGVVFLGGQRSGSPACGGILAGMFGILSAAQKFFHR
jgi:hypothetical protein